jgi:hypothetical protein
VIAYPCTVETDEDKPYLLTREQKEEYINQMTVQERRDFLKDLDLTVVPFLPIVELGHKLDLDSDAPESTDADLSKIDADLSKFDE